MTMQSGLKRAFLGREVAIGFGIIAALYLVRVISFQPLKIPAYLLIVAYDVVEVVVPVLVPYHPVGFPVFLYTLAVLAGGVARTFETNDHGSVTWRGALGGVCLLVGSVSVGFGAFVGGPLIAHTDNPTPLAITGTTGVVLLGVGWWLLGRPSVTA